MSINNVPPASFFILSFIPSTLSLSFNFSTITTQQNHYINATGSAYISPQGIQITPDELNVPLNSTVGRATYYEQLHLWDKQSNNLADFSTHFSFVIDSNGSTAYADGIAFFLAPANSTVSDDYTGGGLGLWNYSANSSSTESFFAVEFDTYTMGNTWDTLPSTHVGVDINSMYSVKSDVWSSNIKDGMENDAWITYNASTTTLTVMFTNETGSKEKQEFGSISYVVDLRDHLPEYVIFGFSAATGDLFETNNIMSWEFSSTLLLEAPAPAPAPAPSSLAIPQPVPSSQPVRGVAVPPDVGNQNSNEKTNKETLIVGLSIGLSIFIFVLAFGGYCLWKKCSTECGDEDFVDPSMDKEFEKGREPKEFSYRVLSGATKNFAESEKLGEGGFGGVYKGRLRKTHSDIAVKRVSRGSQQGLKEYQSEVKVINQLKHRNLVQLLGWCHKKKGELLLVYEYMPNGSLDSHLFKGKSILTWQLRYKIAKGLASALLYIFGLPFVFFSFLLSFFLPYFFF